MESRYARNVCIPGFGRAGQQALLKARFLVIGAGGLGSPAILYLAAAGAGTLAIADGDVVSLSNLQRQILYTNTDIGHPKAETACAAVKRLNPELKAICLPDALTAEQMHSLFPAFDCVLDCTDQAATKYLINDIAVFHGVPFVHAGVTGTAGQIMSVAPGHACLRCVLAEPAPHSPANADAGILGAAAGALGAMQAAEAIKLATGFGAPLFDALLHLDLGSGDCLRIAVSKNPLCPACAKGAAPC